MLCGDVMLSLVFKSRTSDSVGAIAKVMRDERLGFIPILDESGHPVGVITDRDLVTRVLASELPPSTPVGKVMTPGPLLTCTADEDVHELEKRMAQQRRSRAIVVDRMGACIGIISLSDVAQFEDPDDAGRLMRELTRRESAMISRP